ncbi:S16 family serine protease [Agromyces laixinhei]|uniref:S16 family serine protease n=1 Tax=Agromyces laixinhei TaxID=2585717 RepID=UPI0018DD2FB3|nr:S16 family serine protease [Agromyces laixinhei]
MSTTTRRRRPRGLAAIAVLATVALTGCVQLPFGGGPKATPVPAVDQKTEVTIPALSGAGDGAVSAIDISVAPNSSGALAVEVSENEVGGAGRTLQASAWNSAIVATLFTGADLATDYRFAFDGYVDGPSAGGIMTAGVMSLLLGDELLPGVAMTGTITPTGTIGPVGGVPAKIAAVAEGGEYTKVLIPLGLRNAPDHDGASVDVVRLGAEHGVEVVEVGDIAEAYTHLTGASLPAPSSAPIPRVTEPGYSSIESATNHQITEFERSESDYLGLSEIVRSVGDGAYEAAAADAATARDLLSQGLVGGALMKAIGANMLMKALSGTYRTADDVLARGIDSLLVRFDSAGQASDVFFNYLDKLDNYEVETLADADALINAYGNAFDAYSLYLYADAQIQAIYDQAGSYATLEDLLTDSLTPLVYLEVSIAQVEAAEAVFEIARDGEGPAISPEVDVAAVAEFFRKAADSNLEVFNADVIAGLAEDAGVSEAVALEAMGNNDLSIALANNATGLVHGIQAYLGEENPNSAYAAMGYGWTNYSRNASLIEKYGTNGIIDWTTFSVVGVTSDARLVHTLDFSRGQVAQAIGVLDGNDYSTVLGVGAFESASLAREGDFEKKFEAIQDYTGTFALSRVLAYLGGFQRADYAE